MSTKFGVGIVIAIGIAGGITASTVTQGCIYHEAEDIEFPDPGHKWCATLADAEEWTSPGSEFPIFDGAWPQGCVCFVEAENDLLLEAPGPMDPEFSQFMDYVAAIRDAARDRCLAMKDTSPVHPFDNCAALADVAQVSQLDPEGEQDCTTFRTAGDSDGEGYDGSPTQYISCSGNTCWIVESFWLDIKGDPFQLQEDSTYGTLVSNGWKLNSVVSGSVAYTLGMRTNDVVTHVNDMAINSTTALDTALLTFQELPAWTVKLKRGSTTITKSYIIN